MKLRNGMKPTAETAQSTDDRNNMSTQQLVGPSQTNLMEKVTKEIKDSVKNKWYLKIE